MATTDGDGRTGDPLRRVGLSLRGGLLASLPFVGRVVFIAGSVVR